MIVIVLNNCVSAAVKAHCLGGGGTGFAPDVEVIAVLVAADGVAVAAVELAGFGVIVEVGGPVLRGVGDPLAADSDAQIVRGRIDGRPHTAGAGLGAVQGAKGALVYDQISALGELRGGADPGVAAVLARHGKATEGIQGVQRGIAAVRIVGRARLKAQGLIGDRIEHGCGDPA